MSAAYVVTDRTHPEPCAGCDDAADHAVGLMLAAGARTARASVHAGGGTATHAARVERTEAVAP